MIKHATTLLAIIEMIKENKQAICARQILILLIGMMIVLGGLYWLEMIIGGA